MTFEIFILRQNQSHPYQVERDEGGKAGRAQTWAESESTKQRASCPVLLTDDSLMKCELYSSQIHTKKPDFSSGTSLPLVTAVDEWNIRFHKDVRNDFLFEKEATE